MNATPGGADAGFFQETAARIIADTTLDAVIYADRNGVIRLWNDAAEDLFGHSAEQAIGQSLDLIIPEKHRGAHWTGWDRVMESGKTRYGHEPLAAPGVTAAGERVSLEFSITMLKDAEGQIEGIAAILRDVSKRWEAEREMRKELRELKGQLKKD
ncbi:PAS domain-containing protein [Corynebacterium halotolerans]|uniref:PAS domain-containing protein n=1 Tax=Corynebacterium halotolerans TaxID=225326 RepID=UPI003CFA22AC